MYDITKFTTEETLIIVFGLLIIFIGLPFLFICCCCNDTYKNSNERILVSNNKIITDFP